MQTTSSPARSEHASIRDATRLAEPLVMRKVSRHLLLFLFVLFVSSFLDRINIGFAGFLLRRVVQPRFAVACTQASFASTSAKRQRRP